MLPTLWTDRFKCTNWCAWHTAGVASHSGNSSIRAKLHCSQASSEHLPTIIAFTTSLLRSTNQKPKDQEWTELFYLVNVCFLKETWNIYIQSPKKIKTRCEPAYQIIQLNTVVSLITYTFISQTGFLIRKLSNNKQSPSQIPWCGHCWPGSIVLRGGVPETLFPPSMNSTIERGLLLFHLPLTGWRIRILGKKAINSVFSVTRPVYSLFCI